MRLELSLPIPMHPSCGISWLEEMLTEAGFNEGHITSTGVWGCQPGRPERQLAALPTPLSFPPLTGDRLHCRNNTIDLLKPGQSCTWFPQLPTPSVQVVTAAQVVRPRGSLGGTEPILRADLTLL